MNTNVTPIRRVGFCVCGVPVADHFGRRNEGLDCAQARRRWQDRLEVARTHLSLLQACLATVLLARAGRVPSTGGPFETLTAAERSDVTYVAQAALNSLDLEYRKAARERGVDAGTEAFRKWSGARELSIKTRYQLRDLMLDAFNHYDCTLQGVTPLTPGELAAIAERKAQ